MQINHSPSSKAGASKPGITTGITSELANDIASLSKASRQEGNSAHRRKLFRLRFVSVRGSSGSAGPALPQCVF